MGKMEDKSSTNLGDKYLNPCYYHNCQKYSHPKPLLDDLEKIYKDNYGKILPFFKLAYQLGILESTITHWKTCKPNNLLALEKAKLVCDTSLANLSSTDTKSFLEIWKVLRKESQDYQNLQSQSNNNKQVPISSLGNDEEFQGGNN